MFTVGWRQALLTTVGRALTGHLFGSGLQEFVIAPFTNKQLPRPRHSAWSQVLRTPAPQVPQEVQRGFPPPAPAEEEEPPAVQGQVAFVHLTVDKETAGIPGLSNTIKG